MGIQVEYRVMPALVLGSDQEGHEIVARGGG
jgi:hypothetical protein